MSKGVPYDKALVIADKKELSIRKISGDVKRLVKKGNLPDASKGISRCQSVTFFTLDW